jgi:tRNA A37 threonylcarbamoyladenosine dehydratase
MNSISDLNIDADVDFDRRFGGIARLYGERALARFRGAHVCVVGVGGVGSWIVEALARSAIGQLTLIDLDNVAESNINRQIQALTGTVGQAKISALAERIAQINPYCVVNQIEDFVSADTLDEMLGAGTFDSVKAKAAMIAYCRQHALPLVIIGSAGGQTDPTQIAVRDLARTEQEPLLKKVRKVLRSQYGYPRGEKTKFHVDAVFSMEPLKFPETGEVCAVDGDDRAGGVTGLNCAGFGSAMVVTATFGMVAAGHVLRQLADGAQAAPEPVPAVAADATA